MAQDFVAASTEYHQIDAAVVTAYPFTMACWVYADSVSAGRTALALGPQSSAAVGQRLGLNSTSVFAQSEGTQGTFSGLSATAPTANTWHHIAGVWASSASRVAYLNGTGGTPETSTVTFSTSINRTVIGARLRSNVYSIAMEGKLAECAIWNVALSDDEILSLSKNIRPLKVRPESLVMYVPLVRDLVCLRGSASVFTTSGAPAVFDHPRVYQ